MQAIEKLIRKGVVILAPQSVGIAPEVDLDKIGAGTVIYPGTTIEGRSTSIGTHCKIGMGGGAHLENIQLGNDVSLMQGVYRDSTLLHGVSIRNGAELRDNCLLEEGVDIGHTVGLKQTILFPNVVLGSLINFCDAFMAGGRSRRDHSEIGSCMALYNFTPQGDKFASSFGDVVNGLFLDCDPIFIGGQTQIVSPVCVGFGAVVAAGSKLSHDVGSRKLVAGNKTCCEERDFDARLIFNPSRKLLLTLSYIVQLRILSLWYENIREPLAKDEAERYLFEAAKLRVENCVKERRTRLSRFVDKIDLSLELHTLCHNEKQIADHQKALELYAGCAQNAFEHAAAEIDFSAVRHLLVSSLDSGFTYCEAIRRLTPERVSSIKKLLSKLLSPF